MNWLRRVGLWVMGLVFLAVGVGCADTHENIAEVDKVEVRAVEAGVVPLDQIWAVDMPGTRGLDELLANPKEPAPAKRHYLTTFLRKALAPKQPVEKAARGFAIAILPKRVTPYEIHTIREVLRFTRRSNSVPVTEEIGLVFYSNASAYRVEIEKVKRQGSVIDIRYRLAPYQSTDPENKTSVDLAVIPLGKLAAGEYRVEMTRSPMEQKYLDAGHKPVSDEQASRFVCQPFSFEVWSLPKPDPGLSESAIEIPLDQIWASHRWNARDTRSLDWKRFENQPLSIGALGALWQLNKDRAEPGFVVPGIGQEALIAAHKNLPEGEKPTNVLPVGTDFSIVYFSHPNDSTSFGRVERRGNLIEIVCYHYMPSGSGIPPSQLALVPLGKLSVGEYRVNVIERLPRIQPELPTPCLLPAIYLVEAHLRVCQSFSFSIVDAIEEEK